MNEKNIFVLLIGGIPGGGKTYLSNKIISEYQNIYEIKYLNFDLIENINFAFLNESLFSIYCKIFNFSLIKQSKY